MEPGSLKYRYLYAVWGFFECLGFGGLIYGWASLVYVLKEEGLYSDLCPSDHSNDTSVANATVIALYSPSNVSSASFNIGSAEMIDQKCPERDARLTLVFTVAMAMFCVGCFIMGQINYKCGIRITRLVAAVIFIVGALMIAFTSNDVPLLLFPGLSLLGAGGITYLMTNMQLSNLFPRGGSAVVGLMCGGFDASSGVQLMIKFGHENGISRQTSYIILACTHLLTLISTFFFLPKDFIHKPPVSKLHEVAYDGDAAIELTGKKDDQDEQENKKPSLISCMLSPTYILHVMWLSILQLRFYFFLSSLNKNLEMMVGPKNVSHYTDVSMYILMCGLFASPFAGVVCDFFTRFFASCQCPTRRSLMPLVIPLALTTTLCIAMSGLFLNQDPTTLYAVFVFLLFFRSFMYTLTAGLVGALYPSEYFGIMYGILIIIGGVVSMFQYALFTWEEASGFMQVNLFLLALMVITYGHPFYLWITCKRAETSGSFSIVKQ